MIEGRDEVHSEGSYYLEWWDGGKRYHEGAGPNAFAAAEKVRVKQAELTAVRSGIIPPPATVELVPQRTMLPAALDGYKDYVQYHRTLRTFRTYRPIVESFNAFCKKNYVDEVRTRGSSELRHRLHEAGTEGQEHL
jgi:hypothetical protein